MDTEKIGKRCVTCKYSRDPRIEHSEVVDMKVLTCFHNLPHACRPWNSCNFWEPKEDAECAK